MEQFPTGRWPDQISFDQALDTYKWSLGGVKQIQALDHIHVINYDQDGADPYIFELILPVMENLPAGGRMYFFYVSRCHNLDVLKFSTVALSGNTVNSILGSYSFTLTGEKTLFVCVGIKGNYIIHPINLNISPIIPPTTSTFLRGVFFDKTTTGDPVSAAAAPFGYAGYHSFPSTDTYPAIGAAIGNTDMLTAFTPNVAVSGFRGFRCTVPGFWSINFHNENTITFTGGIGNPQSLGSRIFILDSTGTTVKYYYIGNMVQIGTSLGEVDSTAVADEVKCPLEENDIVLFSSAFVGGGGTFVSGTWDLTRISFIWLGDYPVVAPPALLMATASDLSLAKNSVVPNEIVMGSSEDTPQKRKELHRKLLDDQKQETQKRMDRQISFVNQQLDQQQQPSQAPSFTLADVENIVRKVMSSASVQSISPPASSSSSSSSALPPPPSRKRARANSVGESESDVVLVKK